jgi:hypothetical protein
MQIFISPKIQQIDLGSLGKVERSKPVASFPKSFCTSFEDSSLSIPATVNFL